MRLSSRALCLALALAPAATRPAAAEDGSRLVRESEARTPEDELRGFRLPAGFEIQLFADDAQVGGKPVNLAFDGRGRLWVTSTREYPLAVKRERWSADTTRARGSKDTIRILEDRDGDGRADKVTIFADDLNIPTGVQPLGNGCVAWSIPNILLLEDTKHDGRAEQADKRTILFGPLGWERDTHGMISSLRLGLDGWIYATHGFSNTSHFRVLPRNRRPGTGPPASETLDITSGSVFRFKPDGSAVELWTRGQVNPFGLCWDSWGNLYSADCHSSPIYQLIRGAEYPQFGGKPGPLGFGPVMCDHAHGSTGIAGLVYLDGGVWGPEWDDHILVGNPVTSKVNQDLITFTGSTPKANEQPDFITSDDGWFRPVDLQLGPDRALYIADFYSRIIGHYEVPLDHPGRDRGRGRIWRVVRRGFTGRLTDCGLTAKPDAELVAKVKTDAALVGRQLAYHELVSRGYDPMPQKPAAPVGLETRPREGQDGRRFVSEVMESAPTGSIPALLGKLKETPAGDTHLRHAVRIALRRALEQPGGYSILARLPDPASHRDELIRISCAVGTPEAANWLLEQIKSAATKERDLPTGPAPLLGPDRTVLATTLSHIARHLPAGRERELADLARQHFGDDLDAQLELFAAVREGQVGRRPLPTRGIRSTEAADPLHEWAAALAQRLLDTLSAKHDPKWRAVTPPTAANPSPWFRAMRKCADGKERAFLDSHPPGGERLTGTLRSKVFDLPPRLSFWIAGHRGFPIARAHDRNFIRLVNADTGTELAITYPPRHDVARSITWQTGLMPAKRAYLEITDGDSFPAYAWLAVGGFAPPVVGIPDLSPQADERHVRAAAELAMLADARETAGPPTGFSALIQRLRGLPERASFSPETRVALARLGARDRPLPREIPELARDPELAATIFRIVEDDSPDSAETAKAFRNLASRTQVSLASALASSRETAAALLASAPPRVLADPLVTGKIRALNDPALARQLADATTGLPSQNDAVNALISTRLKTYDPAQADAERGKAVFVQACGVCHRIGVWGNIIGPQLDGIGARGAERLLEDILDPNRAVDPAFRLHIVRLKSGELKSGLLRREQADAIVLADATAQEHVIARKDIAADEMSPFSLMPSSLGGALTGPQLNDLLKFLLERRP